MTDVEVDGFVTREESRSAGSVDVELEVDDGGFDDGFVDEILEVDQVDLQLGAHVDGVDVGAAVVDVER